ncbi:2-oxo-4-hydroxy-4-carboxy-5-ureidoimidazoline decarboxylase [Lichenicoccus sp.]|uniref:2-oxo-4-hydroxy-4-carboxy-5-ureidoimidazoline decarboxylase n=1 Tax=Lichenicoccus sp. TaxID=2781899 RepID=UPI003D0D655F
MVFNHLGGGSEAVAGRPNDQLVTLADVNAMDRARFDATFGVLVENTPWVLERTYAMLPFADTSALRAAFHDVLLTGSPAQQMQLMTSFADLGHEDPAEDPYRSDHARAGLGGLAPAEREEVQALAAAYRKQFGFPLIICAREVERYGRVLANGWYRMANAPSVEHAAALIEIAKIANHRLDELVANANPITSAQRDRFTRMTA